MELAFSVTLATMIATTARASAARPATTITVSVVMAPTAPRQRPRAGSASMRPGRRERRAAMRVRR
jgi:hypothetical protein